ncbi:hypothetical protein Tco_0717589 [Tanacetum coccineum]
MTTLAEHMIVDGADNRPPMLEKSMYNSWSSRMLLYIKGKEHGRIMLNSILEGPLVYVPINENGVTRLKTYEELSDKENIQDDCDLRAMNIVLQGTELTQQKCECKLYNEFDRFVSVKGESLHEYYLRFAQLMNDMHTIRMTMQPVQVNTKFLKSLPPEWSKFVKLAKDMHESNYDQLYAYLSQHEVHDIEVRVMRERFPDSLALVQSFAGTGSKSNATSSMVNKSGGNNAAVPAKEPGHTLDDEQIAFLADPGAAESQNTQTTMTHNAAFQANDLDAYDSDCNEASDAKAILMANLSSYDADVISEVPMEITNKVTQCTAESLKHKNENESLTAELERYKEHVKMFKERQKVYLNKREKYIDSQMNDMIFNKNAKFAAFQKEIDTLKFTLSKNVKENESLTITMDVFKKQMQEKENKYLENIVDLEKEKKLLDNIVSKMG